MAVTISSPSGTTVDARVSLQVSGADDSDPADIVGVLTDVSSGQSWNGTLQLVFGSYELTFKPDGPPPPPPPSVGSKDYLSVSVHDTVTLEGCQKSYRQQAYGEESTPDYPQQAGQQKGSDPKEQPGITMKAKGNKPVPKGKKKFLVTVTFPEGQEVTVFLVQLKKSKVPEDPEAPAPAYGYTPLLLLSSETSPQDVHLTVNFDVWDFVYVVATAKGYLPNTLLLKAVYDDVEEGR